MTRAEYAETVESWYGCYKFSSWDAVVAYAAWFLGPLG